MNKPHFPLGFAILGGSMLIAFGIAAYVTGYLGHAWGWWIFGALWLTWLVIMAVRRWWWGSIAFLVITAFLFLLEYISGNL